MKSLLSKSLKPDKTNKNQELFYFYSLGLIAVGTGGLIFATFYDVRKRHNLSYLVENFLFPEDFSETEMKNYENKIVYISGFPIIKLPAKDNLFNVGIENCIYLRRVSEMYQNYMKKVRSTKKNYYYEERQQWSSNEQDIYRNPPFPSTLRSENFISTDIILNNFTIHPRDIFDSLKDREKRLNLSTITQIQLNKPSTSLYNWKIVDNYLYGTLENSRYLNRVGNIRMYYYYLLLNPESGLSVIGQVKNRQIIPISINKNNSMSIMFIKDYLESPLNMIKDKIQNIKLFYHFMTSLSIFSITTGFYLGSIGSYLNKNLYINKTDIAKPLRISILVGITYSYLIYICIYIFETDSIKKKNTVDKLYNYKELLHIDFEFHKDNIITE